MTKLHKPTARSLKKPPAWLFALGYGSMPAEFELRGRRYRFHKLFKHDFYAATGLYQPVLSPAPPEDAGAVPPPTETPTTDWAVLKIQRSFPLWGLPMRWLGAMVANHEIRILRKLQGIAGIPEFLGTLGTNGYIHAFVPGCDLSPDCHPDAAFFRELQDLLAAIHARHVAYVDANKRENILYGEDHRPWLIDFQISFNCRKNQNDNYLARAILKRLQAEDLYHYYKHKTRLAPEICTRDDFARANHQSWYIRVHRVFAQPIIHCRRRFLARYKSRANTDG
jgi:hypothetical protein